MKQADVKVSVKLADSVIKNVGRISLKKLVTD